MTKKNIQQKSAKTFEHPVFEREQLNVGKITRVKGMMLILRAGGTRKEVIKKLTTFYVKYNFNTDNGCVLRHINNTIARIELENKETKCGKKNGIAWWNAYVVVSNTEELVKLTLNPHWTGKI